MSSMVFGDVGWLQIVLQNGWHFEFGMVDDKNGTMRLKWA